jgi:hypothetical protein
MQSRPDAAPYDIHPRRDVCLHFQQYRLYCVQALASLHRCWQRCGTQLDSASFVEAHPQLRKRCCHIVRYASLRNEPTKIIRCSWPVAGCTYAPSTRSLVYHHSAAGSQRRSSVETTAPALRGAVESPSDTTQGSRLATTPTAECQGKLRRCVS